MSIPEKLGGFKVLKNVARISLVSPREARNFPSRVFRSIAEKKINLPFATCVLDDHAWGLNIVVEGGDADQAAAVLEATLDKISAVQSGRAILSLFPHKKNPEITRALFETFGREGVPTDALANSPSAISVVLDENALDKASRALFGPFTFSAYRTPSDWKLAQKGKEQLYKEVVASYQEKRPKVYGLEYQDQQAFLQVRLDRRHIGSFGTSLKRFAQLGLYLAFLATSPCEKAGEEEISFCLPASESRAYKEIMSKTAFHSDPQGLPPVAAFSMNGPHFGDRYGIVSELLMALGTGHVDLLGLSCTIASITGVVPSAQLTAAIASIRERFDIPSVIERT
jgi:aspartokinase